MICSVGYGFGKGIGDISRWVSHVALVVIGT